MASESAIAMLLIVTTSISLGGLARCQSKDAVDTDEQRARRIADFLEIEPDDVSVDPRDKLRDPVPFVGQPEADLVAVSHTWSVPERDAGLDSEVVFTSDGRMVAIESQSTIDDPRRMAADVAADGMRRSNQKIAAFRPLDRRKPVDRLLQVVGQRFDPDEIEEFQLTSVIYDFSNGDRLPALILRLWGPTNPLGMPEDLPSVLRNRIRMVYDIENGEWYVDNTL